MRPVYFYETRSGRLVKEDGTFVNEAEYFDSNGFKVVVSPLSKGVFKKIDMPVQIDPGAGYELHILDSPPEGKIWKIAKVEGGVPADVTLQEMALNGNSMGYYVSNDSFGGFNFVESYGEGVVVGHDDVLSVRKSNSGAGQQTPNLTFYLIEYDSE